ncbi:centriolar and ciliogenesis-associated protein HYLS1 [Frankliniella occidentalis]|uniref:Centriolar and ciliogenesis-associated protein HYLS1 n=1 Tax=Frankliniella occidentalis TaxID=133901 RepID=A0A6J1S8T8_FRAOC|nr:centriolar and ciliogenesis-associated protein HYLS1 [Frankliniella occidentalis]
MDLVGKIDPAEVLSHLNHLGYQNITPLQLKEFIRDLKKLIVHDQLSSSSGSSSDSLTSLSSSVTSESEYYSTSETSSDQTGALSNVCRNKKSNPVKCDFIKGNSKSRPSQPVSNVSTTTAFSGGTLRRSSTSSSSISGKLTHKENMPPRRGRTQSVSEEYLQEAVRPKTSFIRPWQLQGQPSGPSRVGPSDPVSRYHYYQSLWAKHKCPGEDSHADLRWVIREKMLGQDPHLYSKNQVAVKKVNRIRM